MFGCTWLNIAVGEKTVYRPPKVCLKNPYNFRGDYQQSSISQVYLEGIFMTLGGFNFVTLSREGGLYNKNSGLHQLCNLSSYMTTKSRS